MKNTYKTLIIVSLVCLLSCNSNNTSETGNEIANHTTRVLVQTNYGSFTIELYNETPLHRDNFLKLVDEGAYDSLLFHRVINQFVIQAGDPDSKYATSLDTLGSGDKDYTVPSELMKDVFHKRGAVGAARDGNLERASSAMQFYVVQGKVQTDSTLEVAETRINNWLAQHYFKHEPENQWMNDSVEYGLELEDYDMVRKYNDSIRVLSESFVDFERFIIPEEHKAFYKEVGGIPHLDMNYTVFGEIIEGMEVVDSIASVQTNDLDRPIDDVRILKVIKLE